MYQGNGSPRMAPSVMGSPSGAALEASARLVLDRVRKALMAHAVGARLDPARMIPVLSSAPAPAGREAEWPLALGWLHWLAGDPAAAEPLLTEALRLARSPEGVPLLAEAAYWLGRVRVLLGRPEAVSEYEAILRETRGAPQAVAWLMDLLWRAGRVDRAEQVWKSVRGNKKVTACDEGPLLEARGLLRRGEAAPAERLLHEAAPGNGVVQVERRLLLAWTLTTLKQYDRAGEQFEAAREGPYPAAALDELARAAGTATVGSGDAGGSGTASGAGVAAAGARGAGGREDGGGGRGLPRGGDAAGGAAVRALCPGLSRAGRPGRGAGVAARIVPGAALPGVDRA